MLWCRPIYPVSPCQRWRGFSWTGEERERRGKADVFDFLDGKVGVCGHADFLWLHVYDDEQWIGRVAFKELVDLEIRRP